MTDTTTPTVTRNDGANRYEIRVGDNLAGVAEYSLTEGHILFNHTEIRDEFRSQGLAGALAAEALADAARRHLTIVPLCPYMARYLKRHEVPGAEIAWPEETRRQ